MKNLTIKKVALGVLLAGYAASGAFAATSATTSNTIIGNAPTIKSLKAPSGTANKVSYVVEREVTAGNWQDISGLADNVIRASDRVVVSFDYVDIDGDEAYSDWVSPTAGVPQAGANIPFEVYFPAVAAAGGSPAKAKVVLTPDAGYTNVDLTTTGEYIYSIPATAAGRTIEIGLTPMSEYGAPWQGTRISGNLFTTAIGDGTPPCTSGASCIIEPDIDSLEVQIVHTVSGDIYGSSTAASVNTTASPKIGDTFKVVVIDTAASTDVTASYSATAKWSFDAGTTNVAAAAGATAQTPVAVSVVGATYKIDVNGSDVLTAAAAVAASPLTPLNYYAGAQGFKLQVAIQ